MGGLRPFSRSPGRTLVPATAVSPRCVYIGRQGEPGELARAFDCYERQYALTLCSHPWTGTLRYPSRPDRIACTVSDLGWRGLLTGLDATSNRPLFQVIVVRTRGFAEASIAWATGVTRSERRHCKARRRTRTFSIRRLPV